MILAGPLAAVLLSLALGQAGGARGATAATSTASPRSQPTTAVAPGALPPDESDSVDAASNPMAAGLEEPMPSGIPYLPTIGPAVRPPSGVFLDLGLLSELRTLTINASDTPTQWGTYAEVTPALAFELQDSRLLLSLGYAPRITIPIEVNDFGVAILNRATLRAEWRPDPTWTLSANVLAIVGDYSQLQPASTPGGAGPPPPVLNPVRSFETYPYVGIDASLRADVRLSERERIRFGAGYFDFGGVGATGTANQPRTWGPQGEVAFALDGSRTATLTTALAGQDWIFEAGNHVALISLTQSWRQAWSSEAATVASLGVAYSNVPIESATALDRYVPVASVRFDWRQDARHPLHFTCSAALAPYVDTYLAVPYERALFDVSLDWRVADAWQVVASVSAALAPHSVRAPESYGNAGMSVSYSPARVLILSAGGFSQAQLQGAPDGLSGAFRQWTAYLSVALRDWIGL